MGIAHLLADRLPRDVRGAHAAEIWETEHRLLHALGRVRPPAAVQWMVTQSCDLKCGHCYASAGRRAPDELTTAEAERLVIDQVASLGCGLLVFAGGELWLRRDIEGLIERAVDRGLEWAMHTHGGHVPKHRALLERCPPVLAAISLDGDREHHDSFRGRAGSFDAALEAVRVLVDVGCREVVLGTTVTRSNADQLADLFATVEASGAHSWGLHLVAPEGRADLELLPRPAQLRRIARFARCRRARFPVELCNEWGSAGDDDAFYRDRPFACGAGRISFVIGPRGEVMPCTTTAPHESEGNVRDTPLATIWRDGFGRFRRGEEPAASGECWLQTRNGAQIAETAFGAVARPRPRTIDRLPPRLIDLSRRALTSRGRAPALASPRALQAVGVAAFGLAFISACTQPRSAGEPSPSGSSVEPEGAQATSAAPGFDAASSDADAPLPDIRVDRSWPGHLDDDGLVLYGGWAAGDGWWRTQTLRELLAWEEGAAPPALSTPTYEREADGAALATLRQRFADYVDRTFGESDLKELLALVDAAEAAALYDAAFAAHVWRAAERLASAAGDPRGDLEARARLYARLAHHHHVVDALLVAASTHGPLIQRPWLKKSGPPPNWRAVEVPPGFAASAQAKMRSEGPWDSVGVTVRLDSEGAPPVFFRERGREEVKPGASARWGRLDVLYTRAETLVRLPEGVSVELPAGRAWTHGALAARLSPSALAQVDAAITEALAGSSSALEKVERLLPIARHRLRARLKSEPDAAGAPALRLLVVGYDE